MTQAWTKIYMRFKPFCSHMSS